MLDDTRHRCSRAAKCSRRIGGGFGALGLAGVLADAGLLAAAPLGRRRNPLAPKPPHFPPRAKRVIFLFMNGGPSHVDTFDPKPALDEVRRPAAAERRRSNDRAARPAS